MTPAGGSEKLAESIAEGVMSKTEGVVSKSVTVLEGVMSPGKELVSGV